MRRRWVAPVVASVGLYALVHVAQGLATVPQHFDTGRDLRAAEALLHSGRSDDAHDAALRVLDRAPDSRRAGVVAACSGWKAGDAAGAAALTDSLAFVGHPHLARDVVRACVDGGLEAHGLRLVGSDARAVLVTTSVGDDATPTIDDIQRALDGGDVVEAAAAAACRNGRDGRRELARSQLTRAVSIGEDEPFPASLDRCYARWREEIG